MDNEGKVALPPTERLKRWLKDPWHLALFCILILAFVVRLYFFSSTAGQALWWDEAEYLSTAKKWVYDVPYTLNPQRPPLFQACAALLYTIGAGEEAIKFLLVLLPSLLLVFACYLLGKELFDKRVGVFAAFFAAVSWELLFWTARVQPDFFSLLFQVLAIQQMWKYWKSPATKTIVFAGIFAALGFHFKVSGLLVPIIFSAFILIKDRLSAFTNKHYYYFAAAFLATLAPYLLWARITFGNALAFQGGFQDQIVNAVPFGWYNVRFLYTVLGDPLLFFLFLVGSIIALQFFLYADVLVKEKSKCLDPYLFSLLSIAIISVFYIFYIRYTEDRWVFLWLPLMFLLIGRALVVLYEATKKVHKLAAFWIILLLVLWAGYAQLGVGKTQITQSQASYMPVKEGGLWLKEHSQPGDLIITQSQTQITYYAERGVNHYTFVRNLSAFEEYVAQANPRFFTYSALYESHPPWVVEWIQKHQSELKQVYALGADYQGQKVPAFVIYERVE